MVWEWYWIVGLLVLAGLILKVPRLFFKPSITMKGKTLLVIAHPDDESMFFGPTIIRLRKQVKNFLILCLSKGNFYGEGEQRTVEFASAARVLGIDEIFVIDDDRLADGSKWDEGVIREYVSSIIQRENVKNIVTFDDYGISGHHNHISIHESLKTLPETIQVYYLESVSIFRKYLALVDVLITVLIHSMRNPSILIELASVTETTTIMTALRQHSSQMVWFRNLYLMFSRYMIVNTLAPRKVSIKLE